MVEHPPRQEVLWRKAHTYVCVGEFSPLYQNKKVTITFRYPITEPYMPDPRVKVLYTELLCDGNVIATYGPPIKAGTVCTVYCKMPPMLVFPQHYGCRLVAERHSGQVEYMQVLD